MLFTPYQHNDSGLSAFWSHYVIFSCLGLYPKKMKVCYALNSINILFIFCYSLDRVMLTIDGKRIDDL